MLAEQRRTQKRVNALKHNVIPRYRSTIRFIESSLEEEELTPVSDQTAAGGPLAGTARRRHVMNDIVYQETRQQTLSDEELPRLHAYRRAANYLSVGKNDQGGEPDVVMACAGMCPRWRR